MTHSLTLSAVSVKYLLYKIFKSSITYDILLSKNTVVVKSRVVTFPKITKYILIRNRLILLYIIVFLLP